jgi:hypothetical protein
MSSTPKYVSERLFKDSRCPLDCGGGFGSVKIWEGEEEFDMHQAVEDAMEKYGYDSDYADDEDYVGEYTHVHIFSHSGSSVEGRFKDWDKAQEMIRTKMEDHDFQIQCRLKSLKVYDKLPEDDYDYVGTSMIRKLNSAYTDIITRDDQMPSEQ